jgi:hypothetical protein
METSRDRTNDPVSAARGRFAALLAVVAGVALALQGWQAWTARDAQVEGVVEGVVDAGAAGPPSSPVEGPSVSVEIDFGNGVRYEYAALPWFEGMTVGDALDAAAAARPAIAFREQGTGAGAFLDALGGIANEGADRRNWLYRVDGRPGEVSYRVAPLQPGMRVLWSFAAGE